MNVELEKLLDDIIAAGGEMGDLAATVDRTTWDGLPELAAAVAGTEWRGRLVHAVMIGVNDGQ